MYDDILDKEVIFEVSADIDEALIKEDEECDNCDCGTTCTSPTPCTICRS
jgi:hypothetical protein